MTAKSLDRCFRELAAVRVEIAELKLRLDAHEAAALDGPYRLRQWITIKRLAYDLDFPNERAARTWLRRQGIASVKRGRIILVSPVDVDRALRSGRGFVK